MPYLFRFSLAALGPFIASTSPGHAPRHASRLTYVPTHNVTLSRDPSPPLHLVSNTLTTCATKYFAYQAHLVHPLHPRHSHTLTQSRLCPHPLSFVLPHPTPSRPPSSNQSPVSRWTSSARFLTINLAQTLVILVTAGKVPAVIVLNLPRPHCPSFRLRPPLHSTAYQPEHRWPWHLP